MATSLFAPVIVVAAAVTAGLAGALTARRWRRRTHYQPEVLAWLVGAALVPLIAVAVVLPPLGSVLLFELWLAFGGGAGSYVRTRWAREIGVGELGAMHAERGGIRAWQRDRRTPEWREELAAGVATTLLDADGTHAIVGTEVARSDGRATGEVISVKLGRMTPGPGGNSGVVGLLVGRPESGKTTTAIRLLFATAEADPKGAIIIVDPKGDEALRLAAGAIAARHGTEFWEWGRGTPLDPLASTVADPDLAVQACVARVMAAQTFTEEYYRAVALNAFTDAASLLQLAGQPLTLAGLAETLTPAGAASAVKQVRSRVAAGELDPMTAKRGLAWVSAQDAKSWTTLAGSASRLSTLARSGLGSQFASANGGARTISDLASTSGVSYLHLDAGMWPDAALQVAELLAVGLMQDVGRIAQTSQHTITMFIDEVGAIPATRMDAMLQRGRSAGFSVYLAAQTLAGIGAVTPELVSQITGTLSWLIGHAAIGQSEAGEDDAERISRLAGTRIEHELTTQTSAGLLALPTGVGSQRQVDAYIVHPNLIRALPRGRAVVVDVSQSTTSRTRARLCAVAPFPPSRSRQIERSL